MARRISRETLASLTTHALTMHLGREPTEADAEQAHYDGHLTAEQVDHIDWTEAGRERRERVQQQDEAADAKH